MTSTSTSTSTPWGCSLQQDMILVKRLPEFDQGPSRGSFLPLSRSLASYWTGRDNVRLETGAFSYCERFASGLIPSMSAIQTPLDELYS